MKDKSVILIIGEQCHPEDEEKFNKWYNEIHIPMLLKFQGLKEATRYKIIDGSEVYPKYLAILRFDNRKALQAYETSPERAASTVELKDTWKDRGFEVNWRTKYEVIKTWQR